MRSLFPSSSSPVNIRDVGVGDGDGVVNPEEPELMVFDEVTVQELPQSCCIS
jgi:hypothetical protein